MSREEQRGITERGRNYGATSSSTLHEAVGNDSKEIQNTCDNIASNIFKIVKAASTLEKNLVSIGSKNDTDEFRESIHVVTSSTAHCIAETTANLDDLGSIVRTTRPSTLQKNQKLKLAKLTSDFQQAIQKFSSTQKSILNKMKDNAVHSLVTSTVISEQSGAESEDQEKALIDAEAERQRQYQLEFEQGMLLERQNRIQLLESNIIDVNEIMQKLAKAVAEQGEAVDSIEQNIDGAYVDVEQGREQLQKAEISQRKYRKRMFCLLAVGFVIVLVVIIVLITSLRN